MEIRPKLIHLRTIIRKLMRFYNQLLGQNPSTVTARPHSGEGRAGHRQLKYNDRFLRAVGGRLEGEAL